MKKIALAVLLFLAIPFNSLADHMIAARIYYEWVTGTTYIVTIEKYYECGTNPSYNIPICGWDVPIDSIFPGTPQFDRDTIFVVPITCDTIVTNCQILNSPYIGWKMVRYTSTVDLQTLHEWHLGSQECCFGTVDNMENPTVQETLFIATLRLDNVTANNSARTPLQPRIFAQINQPQQIDLSAVDPDGDSLVYQLAPVKEQSCYFPLNANYEVGYSYSQPISSSVPVTLDPVTGILSFTPDNLETDLINYQILEYRNGVLCGSVYRHFQVQVVPTPNQYPQITGINGTNSTSLTVCAGDSVHFDVFTSDADLDSTSIKLYGFNGDDGTLTISPGLNETATFSWITDSADARAYAYTLEITANDNHCIYNGAITKAYSIQVNFCPNNQVWPGDANADLTVDASDLLPIGIAYGSTGPMRNGASLNWTGQPCQGWSQQFISGVDYKHSDCNGNGIINSGDTLAIYQNYGLSHMRLFPQPIINPGIAATIQINLAKDTIAPGETINGYIILGDAGNNFNGYGIAFDLNTNASLATFTNGEIEQTNFFGSNILSFNENNAGRINAAITRINHTNTSGNGQIYHFNLTADPSISSLTNAPLNFTSSVYSDESGLVDIITCINNAVVIDPFVGLNETENSFLIHGFVANGYLYVENPSDKTTPLHYSLTNTLGQQIMAWSSSLNHQIIPIENLNSGIYFLNAYSDKRISIIKLMIRQ